MGKSGIIPMRVEDLEIMVYPSVTKGPMDISKAKDKLNFKPTPLRKALEETVAYYDKLYRESEDFQEEVHGTLAGILEEAIDFDSDKARDEAIAGLERELAALLGKDEL